VKEVLKEEKKYLCLSSTHNDCDQAYQWALLWKETPLHGTEKSDTVVTMLRAYVDLYYLDLKALKINNNGGMSNHLYKMIE